jgi:hypothetical protein
MSETSLPTLTFTTVPTEMQATPSITPEPSTAASTNTPIPTLPSTMVLEPGMPAPGVWISNHDKKGSRTWIEMEVYYVDGKPMADVLEACVDYSCELFEGEFEAYGCSGSQSPKEIPFTEGRFQINFNGLMMENVTHQSKLGMISGQSTATEVITGTWILPACDYWLPLDLKFNATTAAP